MKLTRADRWMWAVTIAAGAAMVLCFAARSTTMTSLDRLPYEPPAIAETVEGDLVNINTAGLEELMSLPGIGPVKAQAILDDREANGPYRYAEDLIRVKGIGEGTFFSIQDKITTGGTGDAQDIGG